MEPQSGVIRYFKLLRFTPEIYFAGYKQAITHWVLTPNSQLKTIQINFKFNILFS
jgi:hypothetical protein